MHRYLFEYCHACYVVLTIFLCGNVESYPRPTTAEMPQNVLKGQADIRADVAGMKAKFSECGQLIRDVDSRLRSPEQLMEYSRENSPIITALQSSSVSLQNTVTLPSRKLVDLEDCNRRANVIFYGIFEESKESDASLRKSVVNDAFDGELGGKCTSEARIVTFLRKNSKLNANI